jgi:hypothetical protein
MLQIYSRDAIYARVEIKKGQTDVKNPT